MSQPARLPDGWRWATLPEIIGDDGVFIDGDWVESKDQDPEGDVRLIQLADIGEGEFIDKSARFLTSAKAKALKCTDLEPGDVLIARMPDPLGRACMFPGLDQRCVTVVDVCIVRPDPRLVDARCLCRLINADGFRRELDKYIVGTTRQRISRGNLAKIQFPLPPLAEQKRIAAVLDKADDLRGKRRQALATLDTLLQSVFLDMFGDPLTNPKEWEVKALGDIAELENGDRSSKYPSGDDIKSSGVLFLNTKNVVDNELDLSEAVFITPEKFETLSRGRARRNDLIITLRGTLGSCCIFDCDHETAFINAQMMIIRPEAHLHHYLHALLTSDRLKDHLGRIGSGSAVPQLTASQMSNLSIPIPPLQVRQDFASRIAAAGQLKRPQRLSHMKIDCLFAALQSAAFAGTLVTGEAAKHPAAARSAPVPV